MQKKTPVQDIESIDLTTSSLSDANSDYSDMLEAIEQLVGRIEELVSNYPGAYHLKVNIHRTINFLSF